ncbi:MAG: hypothetical protein R3B45_02075 [Bdellovibrionota bacterium]
MAKKATAGKSGVSAKSKASKPAAKSVKKSKVAKESSSTSSKVIPAKLAKKASSKKTASDKSGKLAKKVSQVAKKAGYEASSKSKKTNKVVPIKSSTKTRASAKAKDSVLSTAEKKVLKVSEELGVVDSLNMLLSGERSTSPYCPNCSTNLARRRRDFSEQALTVLLIWGEISADCVDQPLCDDCYDELREVLIDRADEVELALRNKEVERIREIVSKVAS